MINIPAAITYEFLNIEREYSAPYSKQENSIVERANKEVLRHLRNMVHDTDIKAIWDIYLPFVQRIMNAKVHSSTGVTPAQLLYGDNIQLDRNILPMLTTDDESDGITSSEYMQDLIQHQRRIIEVAIRHQKKINDRHQQRGEEEVKQQQYEINDYVLVDKRRSTGRSTKFGYFKEGPARIVQKIGKNYEIINLNTMKKKLVPYEHLSPYIQTDRSPNPTKISAQDKGMFVVKRIHKHSGKTQENSKMMFLVEWEDYPDQEDWTWEPWTNLMANELLHQYLKAKKLHRLIPKRFRT